MVQLVPDLQRRVNSVAGVIFRPTERFTDGRPLSDAQQEASSTSPFEYDQRTKVDYQVGHLPRHDHKNTHGLCGTLGLRQQLRNITAWGGSQRYLSSALYDRVFVTTRLRRDQIRLLSLAGDWTWFCPVDYSFTTSSIFRAPAFVRLHTGGGQGTSQIGRLPLLHMGYQKTAVCPVRSDITHDDHWQRSLTWWGSVIRLHSHRYTNSFVYDREGADSIPHCSHARGPRRDRGLTSNGLCCVGRGERANPSTEGDIYEYGHQQRTQQARLLA